MLSGDLIDARWEATFVPLDPPRASYFALWDPKPQSPEPWSPKPLDPALDAAPQLPLAQNNDQPGTSPTLKGLQPIEVSLVRPGDLLPSNVEALRLPIRDAIEVLGGRSVREDSSGSVAVWGAVLRAGLGLIARARLLPWVSPDGWDAWRVDPLDPADHDLVDKLAGALPAVAHAIPSRTSCSASSAETIAAGTPASVRVVDPAFAIRACWDALGDRMVRTAGAASTSSSPLFAQLEPTRVPHLRPWVNDIATEHCAAAVFAVRVEPPADLRVASTEDEPRTSANDHEWTLRFELASRRDPSLVVAAADLWRTPAEVLSLLGSQAEVDLLAGVRRAAERSAVFEPALADPRPESVSFPDTELDPFLDSLDELADAGIEVRWPATLVAPFIERRLVASSAASSGGPAIGDLYDLIAVDWEYVLDGLALSADELAVLSHAKRSVVPIRGRWVRVDARLRERLTHAPPQLTFGETLAAGLSGTWSDPSADETISVRLDGALAGLLDSFANNDVRALLEPPEPEGLTAQLRPYQKQGLGWMAKLAHHGLGGVLADDMGLGKTVQILALHALRGGPTLVVCPTSLLANWEREAARFVPGARIVRYHGPGRELEAPRRGDIVVTTYGVVRSDIEKLGEHLFDLVVADEAQQIKNSRSRSARAMRGLQANARFAVTGTPIENQLSELWALMDWVVPGLFGPLDRFRRDLALPIERDNDVAATRRLTQLSVPFLLRRRKSDPGIAPELPAKTERNVFVPLTAEQASLYRATAEEVLADVAQNDGLVRHGLVLKLLTALKQITNHPAHYLGQRGPLPDRSGKLAALDDLLDAALDGNESSLVFTQYVAMAELLCEHLADRGIDAELLHGGLSPTARQALVDRFQAGEIPVLLLSLRAGGTGLNLTQATQVIHFDRWWNPAVEDQATDRAYRIGQDQAVTVHRLITEGTVEDRVAQLLEAKRELADRVIGSGESWFSTLDDSALASLVRLEEAPAEGRLPFEPDERGTP